MKGVGILCALAGLGAVAVGGWQGTKLFINGKQAADAAIVHNGKTYVSLDALAAAGASVGKDANKVTVRFTPIVGGANQADALEGGLNEWLANGVFRMRVTDIKAWDDGTFAGWEVTVEVGNTTKQNLWLADVGVVLDLMLFDSKNNKLGPSTEFMDFSNGILFTNLPPGGTVKKTGRYMYPLEIKGDARGGPGKFLIQVDKSFPSYKRYAWSTQTPSMRFFLDR